MELKQNYRGKLKPLVVVIGLANAQLALADDCTLPLTVDAVAATDTEATKTLDEALADASASACDISVPGPRQGPRRPTKTHSPIMVPVCTRFSDQSWYPVPLLAR